MLSTTGRWNPPIFIHRCWRRRWPAEPPGSAFPQKSKRWSPWKNPWDWPSKICFEKRWGHRCLWHFVFFKQRQPFESWWILLPCFVHNQFQWCPVPLVFFSRPHLSQLRQQIGVSSFNTPGRQLVGPSWKTYAASAPRFKDEDGDGNAWTVGLRCQDIYFRVYIYIYLFIFIYLYLYLYTYIRCTSIFT